MREVDGFVRCREIVGDSVAGLTLGVVFPGSALARFVP
jgi:hypothetical protein